MLYIWYQEWAIRNYKCTYLMSINGKDPSMFWSKCKNISNISDSQFNSMKNIALVNIQDMSIIKITIIIIMNFKTYFLSISTCRIFLNNSSNNSKMPKHSFKFFYNYYNFNKSFRCLYIFCSIISTFYLDIDTTK